PISDTPAPEPRPAPASEASSTLPSRGLLSTQEAWQRWLDEGRGVPPGLGAFLRSATVRDAPDGRINIAPLPGPAVERLEERATQAAIRAGLSPLLGRPVEIRVEVASELPPAPARVTAAEVREDTMQALFRQEPRLRRAVEELDLELMD